MSKAKDEAAKMLAEMIIELLPVKLTEEQVTQVQDKAYDAMSAVMEAVAEEFYVHGRS